MYIQRIHGMLIYKVQALKVWIYCCPWVAMQRVIREIGAFARLPVWVWKGLINLFPKRQGHARERELFLLAFC